MPKPPVSDLTSHAGYWLRLVSNHVSQAFAVKLADQGITVAEWSVMRTLYGKASTAPSRVAAEMGMTRGAITKLADRLITKACLTRTASAEDGRAQTLALTPRGAALVPALAALADRNDADFFGCLSPAERDTLLRLLRRVAEHGDMTTVPID